MTQTTHVPSAAVYREKRNVAPPRLMTISIVSVIGFLSVWELACRLGWIEPIILPAPS